MNKPNDSSAAPDSRPKISGALSLQDAADYLGTDTRTVLELHKIGAIFRTGYGSFPRESLDSHLHKELEKWRSENASETHAAPMTAPAPIEGSTPLTAAQVASLLGVHINTVYLMRKRRQLPFWKAGHVYRYPGDLIKQMFPRGYRA